MRSDLFPQWLLRRGFHLCTLCAVLSLALFTIPDLRVLLTQGLGDFVAAPYNATADAELASASAATSGPLEATGREVKDSEEQGSSSRPLRHSVTSNRVGDSPLPQQPDTQLASSTSAEAGSNSLKPEEVPKDSPLEEIQNEGTGGSSQDSQTGPDDTGAAKGEHELRESQFSNIYKKNGWGSQESRSGGGSEIGYTENIRRFLGLVFKLYHITSLLDSPCGDCNWQPHIPGFDEISYTGVDIVKDLIASNIAKYKEHENMRFFQVDLASQPLPSGPYDAAICRDMVQHLPLKAGLGAYEAIVKSGAKYLITSFHSEAFSNLECRPGDFCYRDPMLPPFNFSMPLMYALEGGDNAIATQSGRYNYKMVALWKLTALGQGVGEAFIPIHEAALTQKFVVTDPTVVPLLRQAQFTDFVCHKDEHCR